MSRSIQGLFDRISRTYELINHLLTFGLDVVWRRRALSLVYPVEGERWLDVCTGTGAMAADLQRASSVTTRVVAMDFSREMLRIAMRKHHSIRVSFSLADVHWLPFPDKTFDLLAIVFATRNLSRNRCELVHVFHEFRRVLKPSGVLIHLETSQPPSQVIRLLFHLYVRTVVQIVGFLLTQSFAGYSHLSRTICDFYGTNQLSQLFRDCGFGLIKSRSFLFGAIALHRAVRLA